MAQGFSAFLGGLNSTVLQIGTDGFSLGTALRDRGSELFEIVECVAHMGNLSARAIGAMRRVTTGLLGSESLGDVLRTLAEAANVPVDLATSLEQAIGGDFAAAAATLLRLASEKAVPGLVQTVVARVSDGSIAKQHESCVRVV